MRCQISKSNVFNCLRAIQALDIYLYISVCLYLCVYLFTNAACRSGLWYVECNVVTSMTMTIACECLLMCCCYFRIFHFRWIHSFFHGIEWPFNTIHLFFQSKETNCFIRWRRQDSFSWKIRFKNLWSSISSVFFMWYELLDAYYWPPFQPFQPSLKRKKKYFKLLKNFQ